jgi:hypothetical protein
MAPYSGGVRNLHVLLTRWRREGGGVVLSGACACAQTLELTRSIRVSWAAATDRAENLVFKRKQIKTARLLTPRAG